MNKRKKYPKLPNGYGSIKFLGKNRRNPYAVHPPTTEFNLDGVPQTPKAICYTDTWIHGFMILTAYKAGNYSPEMEKTLYDTVSESDTNLVIQKLLANYNRVIGADLAEQAVKKTFEDVYKEFYDYKFERDKKRVYSKSSKDSTRAAFKNCKELHNMEFSKLRHEDLQNVLDSCCLKHSSMELILSLFHQMYKYAIIYELVEKDSSQFVKINIEDDDEHGVPFTQDELQILWKNKEDETVKFILIMCYSGYRIKAYNDLQVNLKSRYFQGGVKTAAGKDRIVPIHSGIYQLVVQRLSRQKKLLPCTPQTFRMDMYNTLERLGIKRHTPHDCRHTFSTLCEKYKVNENDRKRMLGHSFGSDITNGIYGHRELDDLRAEIEKIKICY